MHLKEQISIDKSTEHLKFKIYLKSENQIKFSISF